MTTKEAFRVSVVLLFFLLLQGDHHLFADETKPNIVLIYLDDFGWRDTGFNGSKFYETPNMDRIANEGMNFVNAYANAPNCAPSRACLMSGQYSPRHGIYTVGNSDRGKSKNRKLIPVRNQTILPASVPTLPESIQKAGYATCFLGKWHLGEQNGTGPIGQGFDENFGGLTWGHPKGYFSPYRNPYLKDGPKGEYLTDRLTDEAIGFIKKQVDAKKRKPFFVCLSHYAVHTPIQAKESLIRKYSSKAKTPHHSNAKYAGMIESVDDSVGRVLSKLDELDLTKQTVIIFFSDNGGYGGATTNHPLRGAKGMLYEGGIREPLLVRWPGTTKPGSICDEVVIGIDIYPTLLEITGTSKPEEAQLDGLSLVPVLQDATAKLARDAVYWHFPAYLQGKGDPGGGPFRTTPAGAIRSGDWKLIEWFETGRLELYNLRDDVGESRNLATEFPDKLRALHQQMKQWRKDVAAPIPTQPNPRFKKSA